MEHRKFERIARLNRPVLVTEKLDGTNGLVHVTDTGEVWAGSRNQWLWHTGEELPKHDNYDFARWVKEHAAELQVGLGPGFHYGEWWGTGIARRYNIGERRFSLFNVSKWGENRPTCCNVVPVLRRLETFDVNAVMTIAELLRTTGSIAAPGFMDPEGVVVFHEASQQYFKYTLDGDGHKSQRTK